jgi:uridylate kinase
LPGQYRIMDNVALTILERSKIEAVVLAGERERIVDAVARDFDAVDENTDDTGTVVCDVTIEHKKK